jgi:lysozyme
MSVLGIDVSHYNGKVDWWAVARSNVKFAFAKASEGSSIVDPTFEENWAGMRAAGVLRGAYHFARPSGDAEAQAVRFASLVGALSWGELPPVLDLEVMDGLTNPKAVTDWTVAFVRKAEALLGCELIIYTGGLWRNQLGNPNVPELATRLLWTARYGSAQPVVPQTWQAWSFWQFTDGHFGDVQNIPGVSGPCDCNRYAGELADLQALSDRLAGTQPPAPPTPAPVPNGDWPGRLLVWPSAPALRGPDVATWQARLSQRGFSVTTDGIYGPRSKAACVAFQRHAGLEPDGIVGRRTWEATFDPSVT